MTPNHRWNRVLPVVPLLLGLMIESSARGDDGPEKSGARREPGLAKHLLPGGCTGVVTVDLEAIRRTGRFDHFIESGFREIKGFDSLATSPGLESLDFKKTVLFTHTAVNEKENNRALDDHSVVTMTGRFDHAAVVKALDEKVEAGELTKISIADLPVYVNHRLRDAVFFGLIDDRTLVFSKHRPALTEAINSLSELKTYPEKVAKLMVDIERPNGRGGKADPHAEAPALRTSALFVDEAKKELAKDFPQALLFVKDIEGIAMEARFPEDGSLRLSLMVTTASNASASFLTNSALGFLKMAALGRGENQGRPNPLEKLLIEARGPNILGEITIDSETLGKILDGIRKAEPLIKAEVEKALDKKRKERAAEEAKKKG
jgi:hypothetical protein